MSHMSYMSQYTRPGQSLVWRASRQSLLQEVARTFTSGSPSHQLFRLLADYLAQQWLMFDPVNVEGGSYVPVPVTWSKASSSLGRLPARLPPGGALHVLETEGTPWFDVRPQGKVVFVALKLAPFLQQVSHLPAGGHVDPEPRVDTWMYSLSDLSLMIDHLWPGDTAEAQFARTAVNFLVEAGTQEYCLLSGMTCLVAVPVRLYKVIRATSHLQMDGEKRITLLLRLGGDNVVVRRGPDGEDKLLQLHFGQLTSSFLKHFPTKAKSYQNHAVAIATAAATAAASSLVQGANSPPPTAPPRAPASFASVAAGSSSMGGTSAVSSRQPSHTSSSSPSLQVDRLTVEPSRGSTTSSLLMPGSPTMQGVLHHHMLLGGSGTSSFANSPPSHIPQHSTAHIPHSAALLSGALAAQRQLSLLNDAMGNTIVSAAPPTRSFSPNAMLGGNGSTSSTNHIPSLALHGTSTPPTPDALAVVDHWPLSGLDQMTTMPPQMQVLSVHGSQYSLVQAVASSDSKRCALVCRTAGTGLGAQLTLLQVYVPHPLHTCFFIDAADITPGSWLHAELQQLLLTPTLVKVVHDGRQCVQALGDVQLVPGPAGLLDTRVMHALLRELQQQAGGGAPAPPEPSKHFKELLECYGLESCSAATSHDDGGNTMWARRPLSSALLSRAAREAAAMPVLAGLLQQELARVVTGGWVLAASAAYCQGRPQDGFARELGGV